MVDICWLYSTSFVKFHHQRKQMLQNLFNNYDKKKLHEQFWQPVLLRYPYNSTNVCKTHVISFITSPSHVMNYWPWRPIVPALAVCSICCQSQHCWLSAVTMFIQFYTPHTSSMTTTHMTNDQPIEHVVISPLPALLILAHGKQTHG